MKTFVRERWLHQPPRDRQLCGVLAVFLLIVFSVYGLWLPAQQRLDAARALRGQGWELLPVMSFAAGQDTRFGRGMGWRQQLEGLTGHPVLDTLQAVEPLGPRRLADALVIAPCTGPRWPGWPRAFLTRR